MAPCSTRLAARSSPVAPLTDPRLDPTWSGDGIAGLTANRYRVALSPQDSGRLFVASYNGADAGAMRITRYEANGTLGTSFGGGDGVLQRRFGSSTTAVNFPSHIVRAGGQFVVVGDQYDGRERLGILRMSTTGAYDNTFSGDGRVLYRIFPREHDLLEAWKVQVLSGGKIGIALAAFDLDANDDFVFVEQALVRLNANGTLDTSFHADGIAVVGKDTSDVAFLPNGALYAGRKIGSTHELRKLTPSGTLDTTFSGDGRASVSCGTHFGAYVQADTLGRPLMACRRNLGATWDFLLTRFTPTGTPDPAYGGGDGTDHARPRGARRGRRLPGRGHLGRDVLARHQGSFGRQRPRHPQPRRGGQPQPGVGHRRVAHRRRVPGELEPHGAGGRPHLGGPPEERDRYRAHRPRAGARAVTPSGRR